MAWHGYILAEKPAGWTAGQWANVLAALRANIDDTPNAPQPAERLHERAFSGSLHIFEGAFDQGTLDGIESLIATTLGITTAEAEDDTRGKIIFVSRRAETWGQALLDVHAWVQLNKYQWQAEAVGATLDVQDYGAIGNGVADDTAAIQSAIDTAAQGDEILFPAGDYRIVGSLVVDKGLTLSGESPNTILSLERTPAAGSHDYLSIEAGAVRAVDIIFDGQNEPANPDSTGAHNALKIIATWPAQLHDIQIRDCQFINLEHSGTGVSAVGHAIQVSGGHYVGIAGCAFDTLTGAAAIVRNSNYVWIENNQLDSIGYYPFHVYGSTQDFTARDNVFGVNITPNYGGFIDSFGYPDNQLCQRCTIIGNTILGTGGYGASIRVLGFDYAYISRNWLDIDSNITRGIYAATRFDGAPSLPRTSPPQYITIERNEFSLRGDLSILLSIANDDDQTLGEDWVIRQNWAVLGGFAVNVGVKFEGYAAGGSIVDNDSGGATLATVVEDTVSDVVVSGNV